MTELTLEELSNTEVTSVSRTSEPLADAAAAVTVLTNEDLRRSGATTIPEALRGVPGLHVGRVTSSAWEVSTRGFGGTTSDKLLVLSDTRSIYTPLFSGVFWDVQDMLLEDIERIEIIRGPGASLWGSNASFRSTNDRNQGKGLFALQPPDSWDNLFSGFLQDQIAILDSLRLTIGTKLSYNDFGGFEYQPNGRLAWTFLSSHTVWGAVSRAVRSPNRCSSTSSSVTSERYQRQEF